MDAKVDMPTELENQPEKSWPVNLQSETQSSSPIRPISLTIHGQRSGINMARTCAVAQDLPMVARLIRITTRTDAGFTVVTIDGRAVDSDLGEIRRVRKGLKGAVALNLRGLDACVPAGIGLLRNWLHAGARLQAANPFLEMTLEDAASYTAQIRSNERNS